MTLDNQENQVLPQTDDSQRMKFCALEYGGQDLEKGTTIILLVLEDTKDGRLNILVHPDWQSIVLPEDFQYIGSVLDDFLERAKEEPGHLFEQVCSLGVGPLVTHQTGERVSDYPHLLELCSQFSQL